MYIQLYQQSNHLSFINIQFTSAFASFQRYQPNEREKRKRNEQTEEQRKTIHCDIPYTTQHQMTFTHFKKLQLVCDTSTTSQPIITLFFQQRSDFLFRI